MDTVATLFIALVLSIVWVRVIVKGNKPDFLTMIMVLVAIAMSGVLLVAMLDFILIATQAILYLH